MDQYVRDEHNQMFAIWERAGRNPAVSGAVRNLMISAYNAVIDLTDGGDTEPDAEEAFNTLSEYNDRLTDAYHALPEGPDKDVLGEFSVPMGRLVDHFNYINAYGRKS